jgi:hypothetical protein
MKLLRLTLIIVFVLSILLFAGFKGYQMKNEDNCGPVIQCDSDHIKLSTKSQSMDLLKGVKAYDKKDGNVSDSLVVENLSKINLDGTRTITYAAFDSDQHITKATRVLIYSDYVPPRFQLSKPLSFVVGADNILENMTVLDSIDGDLTNKVKYIVEDDNFGKSEGSYLVEFQVTNSAGQTAFLPAKVKFHYPNGQQNLIPDILLDHYILYLKKGTAFDAKEHINGVQMNGRMYKLSDGITSDPDMVSKEAILVNSDVNNTEVGTYEVNYSMTNDAGITGTTKLIVVVEE